MTALIAVAGVNTGADEAVPDVKTCPQGGLHIGPVVRIYIRGIIGFRLFGSLDQFAYYLIAVGAAGVLDTNADLPLSAA